MSWYLYLLECEDGSLYTGIARDVEKRFALHLAGKGAKYTRSHPPRYIVGQKCYPDRSTASKAEYALKQLKPAEKRAYFLENIQGASIIDLT
jgi:putative endonuclease